MKIQSKFLHNNKFVKIHTRHNVADDGFVSILFTLTVGDEPLGKLRLFSSYDFDGYMVLRMGDIEEKYRKQGFYKKFIPIATKIVKQFKLKGIVSPDQRSEDAKKVYANLSNFRNIKVKSDNKNNVFFY